MPCSLRVSKVRMPILILSGLASTVDKVKGLGIGAEDYLTKPFHRKSLWRRSGAVGTCCVIPFEGQARISI